jgi:hypothetical protein
MINGLSVTREGLVLMSLRTTSGVIAVEKESGNVVWHAGADIVAQQHTPVEMANGTILVFDNGNLRRGNLSALNGAGIRSTHHGYHLAISRYFPLLFSRPIWEALSAWRTATPLFANRHLAVCLK